MPQLTQTLEESQVIMNVLSETWDAFLRNIYLKMPRFCKIRTFLTLPNTLDPKVCFIWLVWTQPSCAHTVAENTFSSSRTLHVCTVCRRCGRDRNPKEVGGCISSSLPHRRYWSKKADKMVIVGVSKVENRMCSTVSINQCRLTDDASASFFVSSSIGGLQTNSVHTATHCIGLCTYANMLGHRTMLRTWRLYKAKQSCWNMKMAPDMMSVWRVFSCFLS